MSTTIEAPAEVELHEPASRNEVERDKPWIVIVWNDPINLMSYVTLVLQKPFGYSRTKRHGLMRHRRISPLHRQGRTWAEIGAPLDNAH